MKIKAIMVGLLVSGGLLFASDYEDNVFGYTTEGDPIYKKTIIGAIINTDKRIKDVMNTMVMMTNEIKKNHEMPTLNSAMIKESGDTYFGTSEES
ncbi:hypothetical protein [Helicobacter pylori]|uniref:hypothetical protein n=1 Tax=Helicobacter pylori TaxID=210 RepID=UPI001E2BF60D|nr:hypothetical protein [Helicobacter pylori]